MSGNPAASRLLIICLQAMLAGTAVIMGIWAEVPWLGVAALVILSASCMWRQLEGRRARFSNLAAATAWFCTLLIPLSLAGLRFPRWDLGVYVNRYFAVLAWLVVATILPAAAADRASGPGMRWRSMAICWAFFGSGLWVASAHLENRRGLLFIGVGVLAALLLLTKFWFSPRAWVTVLLNSLLLIIVGIPVADLLASGGVRPALSPDTMSQYYSFQAARRDPVAFERWWNYFVEQWDRFFPQVTTSNPEGTDLYRLKPNSEGYLIQSRVHINSHGFRGPEFSLAKGGAYRIVALGESTTFGVTIRSNDVPWPELLQEMVRLRLSPRRPVEVINAGVPGATLPGNLARLTNEIAALQPDMIISYHGFNGFPLLNPNLPRADAAPPPALVPRAVKLLGQLEYRLKLKRYYQTQAARAAHFQLHYDDLPGSLYAAAYRRLMAFAGQNKVRLAIANFSMAVNDKNPAEEIEFYRPRYPAVYQQIEANRAHTRLLRLLAQEHPEVVWIDTQPGLDGDCEKFIDIIHLTQPGRQQLAEAIYKGIEPVLRAEATGPSPVGQ